MHIMHFLFMESSTFTGEKKDASLACMISRRKVFPKTLTDRLNDQLKSEMTFPLIHSTTNVECDVYLASIIPYMNTAKAD